MNLTGTFTCMQLAVPDMMAAGWGRIVTISSSSAQSGAPNMAHYVASKGGVIGLTKAFARGSGPPGHHRQHHPAHHRRHPMARKAEADGDVPEHRCHRADGPARAGPGPPRTSPRACSFLCSERRGYITGQLIGVNGGMYI